MKELPILVLILLFFLVVSPVLAANSATDVEGTIDGQPQYDYYKEIVKYAAKQQEAKECPAETHLQPKTETVIDRLQKDTIFFFHGHCVPGAMGIKFDNNNPDDPRWIYAKNGPHGEKSLDELMLTNLNFIFFDCCRSAGSVDYHGSLIKISIQRGAKCAFGFHDELQTVGAAIKYGQSFWNEVRKGAPWVFAHEKTLLVLKNDPEFMIECDKIGHSMCGYKSLDYEPKNGDACLSHLQPPPEANETITQPTETTSQPTGLETATITLEQAQTIIREFTGNPTLKVKYDYDYLGSGNPSPFYVSYDGNQSFSVNPVTRRVHSAMHYSIDLYTSPLGRSISSDEAYVIAETFAKKQYPQLWNTTDKVGLNVTKSNEGRFISWNNEYYYPDKNTPGHFTVKGLTHIYVAVAPSGGINSYFEDLTPRDESVSLKPDITEDQAWEIAKKRLAEDEQLAKIHLTDDDKRSLGLVLDISKDKQSLTWDFVLEDEYQMGALILIDAHDGHVAEFTLL